MKHYDLLLLGAGHAHLGVLRRWAMIERPPGRIGLISAGPTAWYSPMLPGLLAGRQHPADCQVELSALCRAAKVELIIQPVESLSAAQQQVQLADGQTLTASWLSLNVGAQVAAPPQQGTAMQLLAVKPFAEFLTGWQQWQAAPQPLAILGGGGAAGVELALALAGQVPQLALFCAGHLLDGLSPGLRLRALGHLRQRGVWVREDCPISRIEDDCLLSGTEPVWRGQRLLLASGVQALPWLTHSGLGSDEQGFVLIAPTLQSYTHPTIFAVGDCASLPGAQKNGRYAVRQVAVLADNLNAALRGLPLRRYRPQREGLTLLASGDGGALLDWHGYSAGGQFYGRWKDYLDRGFIQRHRF